MKPIPSELPGTGVWHRSPRPPKVALLIETSNSYARGLLAGVKEYIRNYGPWNVHLAEHGRGDRPPKWISEWDGDGVLARVENKQIARALAEIRVPVVDLSSHRLLPDVPVVTTDNQIIAQLAFEHFKERGFKRFAFCGVERFAWSVARAGFFDEFVRGAGLNCEHYTAPQDFGYDSDEETDAIGEWLRTLPQPVAVFACYDARGQQVLEACQRIGLSVPEQVAVLGVDNDDLLCELSTPPLSSVIPDTHRTGWKAAELLSRLMRGEKVAPGFHRIPPIGICSRLSTDFAAVEDAHVAKAARFIRERACEGIEVKDVLAEVPLARRALEKRFSAIIGRTLREEITRIQMQRVKDLLVGTDFALAEIAERTGFRHVEYLTVVFKREFGMPPSIYRQENRPGSERTSKEVRPPSPQPGGLVPDEWLLRREQRPHPLLCVTEADESDARQNRFRFTVPMSTPAPAPVCRMNHSAGFVMLAVGHSGLC